MKSDTLPTPYRFTLELIKGALNAARSEMEALIARAAMSPFIREKKDFFTAFLNRDGELVVSTSLTLAGNLVDAILEEYPAETMRPGDLYWYNDAYGTGGAVSHLPDMVFVMPVFHEGRLFAFAEAWGHLWDIGGSVPGSISPHAISVFQEGIMIPPVRVMRDGVENTEVVRIFTRNSRFPDMLRGDLRAIMAACRLGARRLTETVGRHGVEVVEAAFEAMLAESEGALRAEIAARIPDGEYAFRERIDSDAVTDRSYFVDLVLRKGGGALEMDFSASDRQADGPINFLMDDSVPKFMLGLWMCMDRPGIGMNGGFERAVERVVTRPGTLVAPHFPAPLGLRSHTMIRVTSALFGTLAQATGGRASAAPSVYVLYYLRGRNADGTEPLCIEGLSVGFGARTFADGIDAVYYVAQENYPIEFAEMEFGVEIEAFGIHRDSGGGRTLARRLRHRPGCPGAVGRSPFRDQARQLPPTGLRGPWRAGGRAGPGRRQPGRAGAEGHRDHGRRHPPGEGRPGPDYHPRRRRLGKPRRPADRGRAGGCAGRFRFRSSGRARLRRRPGGRFGRSSGYPRPSRRHAAACKTVPPGPVLRRRGRPSGRPPGPIRGLPGDRSC